jgi:tetratricopeptide (TPR) repeat protein
VTRAALAAVLLALLSACSTRPPLREVLPAAGAPAVELVKTPFFPQDEYQCGPAALATVLLDSGAAVSPAELVPQVFVPGRQGSLQPELLGAARRHGRLAYVLAPDPGAFMAELAAGRPVLVLQNLGTRHYPGWHYAVLVGYDAGAGEVLLRSGRTERLAMRWSRFAATVERAGYWGVVVLEPGSLPATAEPRAYVAAVAALEAAGRRTEARRAYEAGLERWPDDALLWLGRGNAAHGSGDRDAAIESYRRAAGLAPAGIPARYNLAEALLEAGCASAAARVAGEAAMLAAGTSLETATRELLGRAGAAAATTSADPAPCAQWSGSPAPDR